MLLDIKSYSGPILSLITLTGDQTVGNSKILSCFQPVNATKCYQFVVATLLSVDSVTEGGKQFGLDVFP